MYRAKKDGATISSSDRRKLVLTLSRPRLARLEASLGSLRQGEEARVALVSKLVEAVLQLIYRRRYAYESPCFSKRPCTTPQVSPPS